jgi:biopolymer transport protein ExbD
MQRRFSMVAEPNVIPMIDILLVLLIIFILASITHNRRAFDLQLPASSSNTTGSESIVLTVSAGPSFTLNKQAIPAPRLEQELREVFAGRNERVLFVEGARSVPYHDVALAFDAARGAGVSVTAVKLP